MQDVKKATDLRRDEQLVTDPTFLGPFADPHLRHFVLAN